jgi:hypothetical protein
MVGSKIKNESKKNDEDGRNEDPELIMGGAQEDLTRYSSAWCQ